MKLPTNLPEFLKQKRLERGLSLHQMAELVGKNFSLISRYERGKVKPPYEILEKYFALDNEE